MGRVVAARPSTLLRSALKSHPLRPAVERLSNHSTTLNLAMSRISTIFAALADTALAVVLGVVVPLVIAATGWFVSGSYRSVEWDVLATVAMGVWTLALNSAVGIEISPEHYPALGLSQPFGFVIAIAPMLLTAMVAWWAYRTGSRILGNDEEAPWLAGAASVFAFPLCNFGVLALSPLDNVRLDLAGVLCGGTLLWAAFLAIGMRVWEYLPWERMFANRAAAVIQQASAAVRTAIGMVTGLACAATVLLLVILVLRFGEVIGLMQMLQLDDWGVIAVGITQLAYLPTMVVWAMSWMLGAGFDLGVGSHAGPGGTEAGPLPVVPLFGLIPDAIEPVWWSILAVPFAVALLFTFMSRMLGHSADTGRWWERAIAPVVGSLLAAIMMWLLAFLAQGGLGPGRLVQFGPPVGPVFLWSLALFLSGAVIGTFVPLHAVDPGREQSREPSHKQSREQSDTPSREGAWRATKATESAHTPTNPPTHPSLRTSDSHDTPLSHDKQQRSTSTDDRERASSTRTGWLGRFGERLLTPLHGDDAAEAATGNATEPITDIDRIFEDASDSLDPVTGDTSGATNNETTQDAPGRDIAHRKQSGDTGTDASSSETSGRTQHKPSRPSRGRRDTSLRDVLDRPDEPDIYADLD